ncbi:helix-turn-helix domain-containing protein [Hymenobacter bucti]|uniref:Helix-turn-helix domain-containing protein n=1 Tax=Hymenobacter bucti TaxID=1844114 RepID=A0ABW4QTX3_9BACT
MTDSFYAPPLISSAPLPWQGVRVEQYHLEAGRLAAQQHEHHLLLLYQVAQPHLVRRRDGARVSETVYQTGDLGLFPGGEYGTAIDWTTPSDNIYLTLEAPYFRQVAGQDTTRTPAVLQKRMKFNDPFLGQLSRQLLASAGSHRALGRLYVESLTATLCHHLLAHHATSQRRPEGPARLGSAALARIEAYLEAHAAEPVTLEGLAELANLSVFHFARLFKQATGLPPYQYVLRWKIERAKHLLRRDSLALADLSDELGFASPISFAAAFKRLVGCTPQQFQRR